MEHILRAELESARTELRDAQLPISRSPATRGARPMGRQHAAPGRAPAGGAWSVPVGQCFRGGQVIGRLSAKDRTDGGNTEQWLPLERFGDLSEP
jgi:hypothetical protein